MKPEYLIDEIGKYIDKRLTKELITEFVTIKNDCKTGTLGRISVGKFVETIVQILQFLENGTFDKRPKVDLYLKDLESKSTNLNDNLKLVCSRIARAMYSLRNKRNIAHKGTVDTNIYDLRYIYASAQWILSEIVRQLFNADMTTAGTMIEYIQIPVSSIIEDLGERKLIFGKFTVAQEILILLHSYYPDQVDRKAIRNSLDRRSNSTISNSLSTLWKKKLIHKNGSEYKLTQEGFKEALQIMQH